MSIKGIPLQFSPIIRIKVEKILDKNEKINVTILSGSPYKLFKQLKDITTSEISMHLINQAELSYSVKIGKGTIFLSNKYHYDKDTNTLSLYKNV